MKKVLSLALCIVMLLSAAALLSCADKEIEKNKVGTQDEENELPYPLPEDLYFEGESVTFIVSEGTNGTLSARSIRVEEIDGDGVNTAIYERNEYITAKLGVSIELLDAVDYNSFIDTVTPGLMAGDTEIDVLGGYQFRDITIAADDYILDVTTLGDCGADYIDLEAPWWAGDYIRSMSYGNSVFWLTGDLSLRYTAGMYALFANAELYNKYCLENFGDIYDIVARGDWTLDTLSNMSALAYLDTNSNEKVDAEDDLGFVSSGIHSKLAMLVGAGYRASELNADGSVTLLLNSQNTDWVNANKKLYELYYQSPHALFITDDDDVTSLGIFSSGKALFTPTKVFSAEIYLREMQDDYFIVSLPKMNTYQSEYRTIVHDSCTLFGINYATEEERIPVVAATLELMAYKTHVSVTPEYYDSALKYKYTRDDRSAEMIDLIRDSAYTDFAIAWDRLLTNNFARGLAPNLSSEIKKKESGWKLSFNELLEKISA